MISCITLFSEKLQLVAALLQAKERGDPQGWLAFQVGVTGQPCCATANLASLCCMLAAPGCTHGLIPHCSPVQSCVVSAAAAAATCLQTEVSALKLQRTRVERETDDLQVGAGGLQGSAV